MHFSLEIVFCSLRICGVSWRCSCKAVVGDGDTGAQTVCRHHALLSPPLTAARARVDKVCDVHHVRPPPNAHHRPRTPCPPPATNSSPQPRLFWRRAWAPSRLTLPGDTRSSRSTWAALGAPLAGAARGRRPRATHEGDARGRRSRATAALVGEGIAARAPLGRRSERRSRVARGGARVLHRGPSGAAPRRIPALSPPRRRSGAVRPICRPWRFGASAPPAPRRFADRAPPAASTPFLNFNVPMSGHVS